ncbi:MAG: LysR family transcriptional regulator [Nevskia sp.]|nr:LysR family transcriptional regulator [Nevskia sp.]
MAATQIRIRIFAGEEIAFGPGKADLLDAIAQAGSISGGARKLGMSYRRAWQLVDTMNRCFRQPLVVAATGGEKGGGAQLTDFGRRMLAQYRGIEGIAAASIRAGSRKLMRELCKPKARHP